MCTDTSSRWARGGRGGPGPKGGAVGRWWGSWPGREVAGREGPPGGEGLGRLRARLGPARAKVAAGARKTLATRLSPGEKNGRKRMAELACVYDAVPVPRAPEDIISTPAQKRRKNNAQTGKPAGKGTPREPQARAKWVTAAVTDDIPAGISAAF